MTPAGPPSPDPSDRAAAAPEAMLEADPFGGSWARRTFASLAHRNYRLFFIGMAVSSIGGWARSAGQQQLVWQLTQDERWLGWVGAATLFGIALATIPAGAFADRMDRRRVLMLLQLVQASFSGTLATLTALGLVTPAWILCLAIGLGVAGGAEMPFRQSYLVELVGKDGIRNAVALNSIMFNLPLAIGPAIAGEIMARAGLASVFAFDAVSYLAAFAGFACIRTPPRPAGPPHESVVRSLLGGARHLAHDAGHRAILVLLALAMVFGWAYTSQLASYAEHDLHTGVRGYGFLFSSSGIGACLGAVWVAGRAPSRPHATMRRALGALALSLVAMGFWPSYGVAYGARVLAGFAMISFFAVGNSTVQLGLADAVRGRVMALWSFTFSLSLGVGQLLFGVAARSTSVPATFVGGGALLLAAVLAQGGIQALRDQRARSTTKRASESSAAG